MPNLDGPGRTGEQAPLGPDREAEARRYAEAILSTTRQPLLVLDGDLRVETANRAFYRGFRVEPSDTTGRLVYELGNGQWDVPELRDLLERILPHDGTVEELRVVHDFEQIGRRVMLLNAHRLTRIDRPDSILLAIEDITDQEHTRWLLEGEREYARKLIDTSRNALLILGWDLCIRAANSAFYAIFRTTPAETEGLPIHTIGNGQWNIPQLRQLLENVLPDNDAFDDFEVEHDFSGIGHRIMVLNARRVDHMQLIVLAIEDQTEMRSAERALRKSEALLSSILRHAPIGIGLIDQDGRWVLKNAVLQQLSSGFAAPDDPAQLGAGSPGDGTDVADWPGARALRQGVVALGIDIRREIDGKERWLRVSAAPIAGPGEVEQAVVIVEDVTHDKEAQAERELLLGELNHRVRNLFGVIRSLVVQGRGGPEVEDYKNTLKGRLDALIGAQALALESRWNTIDLAAIAERTLEPYRTATPSTVDVEGPPVTLQAKQALSLSLTLHELATNAVKYGALSVPGGRIRVTWQVRQDKTGKRVELAWDEQGGPAVRAPEQRGFGTTLIERVFGYDLHGDAVLDFRSEGLSFKGWFPLT